MRTKVLIIAIVLLVVTAGIVSADTPSVFEMNVMNYYSIKDLADTEFARYTPGLRMAFFVTEWFGLSGEVIMPAPFDTTGAGYAFILSTDLIFRLPLGFFEMYMGLGPAYDLLLGLDAPPLVDQVRYSARAGFDFNITPVFALSVEANHIVTNLSSVIDGVSPMDWLGDTYVGLGIKLKL